MRPSKELKRKKKQAEKEYRKGNLQEFTKIWGEIHSKYKEIREKKAKKANKEKVT